MGVSEIITILAFFVSALSLYQLRRGNDIQLRQAEAQEEANRISAGGVSTPSTAATLHERKPSRWPILALIVLLLMNLGVTAFNRWDWMLKEDPRYLGLFNDSGAVADALSKVTGGTPLAIACYNEIQESKPLETPSCKIAVKIRQLLADADRPPPGIAPVPYYAGFYIQTAPNSAAPARATALLRELDKRGLRVGWVNNPTLKPEQFILLVGLERGDLSGR